MVAVVEETATVEAPIVVTSLVAVAAMLREEAAPVIGAALRHEAIVAVALSGEIVVAPLEAIVAVVPIEETVVVASKETVVEVVAIRTVVEAVVDVAEEASHSRFTLDLLTTAFSCKCLGLNLSLTLPY